MEWIIYVSVAIIAVSFAFLVYYLIRTLVAMKATMISLSNTVESLEKQVDSVTKESKELIHKTNILADDMQRKSDALNSVFHAAKDLGDSFQRINLSVKKVSESVSRRADEQSDQIAQAVKWGNVALQFWEKWRAKKSQMDNEKQEEK
ncbi:DUF948 domain-containing protein [Evansella cellulosilytica]|uniref:DUF948 domain-containing protein n=1 Tax=Evansella cellulosilytica (strain ATCC 21833 / DSM 2522 / FERM P-1141 / JCM 9156 / N-4) TaxID=649639 RepID=E6U174_EVAC2|nr:DUF948 domain-containing protein [Evansella cellulosilytica]ADU31520.1 protein of unknown function DUF948 [Evansella cellulosilytica DSM 2522]